MIYGNLRDDIFLVSSLWLESRNHSGGGVLSLTIFVSAFGSWF